MLIRPAESKDSVPMLGIYNDIILHTTTIYSYDPRTLAEQEAWLEHRLSRGFPVLVAEDAGRVLGYCSYDYFRDWPAYNNTVEHSIYLHAEARRKGIGRRLLYHLISHAEVAGFHVMIASVDTENQGSLRFHEQMGFERVAEFKEVGRKFDRWLNLVFLQRILNNSAQTTNFAEVSVTLEPAFSEDAKALNAALRHYVKELYADLNSDGSGHFNLNDAETEGAAFVVARLKGVAVGCAALRPYEAGTAEIKRMFVRKEARRKGLAKKIIEVLERSARLMGYKRILLETGDRQPEAIRLYKQVGYKQIAAYGRYMGNPISVCFEKLL